MIKHLKNYNFIRIIENNNRILMVNENNFKSIIISKEVFKIIAQLEDIKDISNIFNEYSEIDKIFLMQLFDSIIASGILNIDTSEPKSIIHYIITDFCNLKCNHCCYSAFFIGGNKQVEINANLDIVKKIIEINPDELNVTGGEPLIINNLNEVSDLLEKSSISKIGLSTNATLINEENITFLVKCFNTFNISIDGINEEKSDAIRGVGTYKKVMNAIKLLKNYGVKDIKLSAAFDADTNSDKDAFYEMCNKLEVTPIVRKMSSVGRANDNNFNCEELDELYFYNMKFQQCSCHAGINEISINSLGEVYPCINFNSSEYKMGSILEEDILKKMCYTNRYDWYKAFSKYVTIARDECKDCELNIFCWSCPFNLKTYMDLHGINSLKSICRGKYEDMWRCIWNG